MEKLLKQILPRMSTSTPQPTGSTSRHVSSFNVMECVRRSEGDATQSRDVSHPLAHDAAVIKGDSKGRASRGTSYSADRGVMTTFQREQGKCLKTGDAPAPYRILEAATH